MENTTQPSVRGLGQWLEFAIVGLIFLACANILSRRMIDPDLWGHIQYGEDWLAEGQLPRTASHTYIDPNHVWINHENLSELALAYGHRWFGGMGLMVGKTLLALSILLSMFVAARRKRVTVVVAAACLFPVAGGMAEFWCARPQLASFVCMASMLIILEKAFAGWQLDQHVDFRTLALVIPVIVMWTNAHGGFLAGLGVLLAYLGIRTAEAIWHDRRAAVPTAVALVAFGLVSAAATLANPYGWELHRWLLKSLGAARPEISEWVSIPGSGVTIVPFTVLTLMTGLALCLTMRRRDPAHVAIVCLVALQTFSHCRHLPFLAILFGFWMPTHIQSAWTRVCSWRSRQEQEPLSRGGQLLLGAECGVIAMLLVGGLAWQYSRFGVQRDEYPVSAIQFMADHALQGKMVVTFNWAQYALAAMPQSQVGCDGRFRTCYAQEVVDMNFDLTIGNDPVRRNRSASSGPVDPTRVLNAGSPDLVLINRVQDRPAVEVLSTLDDWVLLYQDSIAQVYGRADRYDHRDSPDYFPPARRQISETPQAGVACWPAMPDRTGRTAFVIPDDERRFAGHKPQSPTTSRLPLRLVGRQD